MNALTESADAAPPAPDALPPQLNPTTNLRALSADDAVERLSQLPAPRPTPPQGSAPAATGAPLAPAAPARRPLTRYAAAALVAALALLAAVLLASR